MPLTRGCLTCACRRWGRRIGHLPHHRSVLRLKPKIVTHGYEPRCHCVAVRVPSGGPGNLVSGDSNSVTGIVGAGHGDLNPAVVCVAARALEGGETEVVVLAAAKEGLVKQHSAEKAVERVLVGLGLRQ